MTADDERSDLIRHLFAVVTGLFEDAATITAVAQGRDEHAAQMSRAAVAEATAAHAITILAAIRTLSNESRTNCCPTASDM